ncbi:MAG: hypothetical protein PHI37_04225 [Candidatus Gracilibacteria bacterium]|nr:hypothetical protein [Candidatus Gracilibacteria bacterium]
METFGQIQEKIFFHKILRYSKKLLDGFEKIKHGTRLYVKDTFEENKGKSTIIFDSGKKQLISIELDGIADISNIYRIDNNPYRIIFVMEIIGNNTLNNKQLYELSSDGLRILNFGGICQFQSEYSEIISVILAGVKEDVEVIIGLFLVKNKFVSRGREIDGNRTFIKDVEGWREEEAGIQAELRLE